MIALLQKNLKVWHAWNFTYTYIYFQTVKVNSYFRMIVKHILTYLLIFPKGMIILQAEIQFVCTDNESTKTINKVFVCVPHFFLVLKHWMNISQFFFFFQLSFSLQRLSCWDHIGLRIQMVSQGQNTKTDHKMNKTFGI